MIKGVRWIISLTVVAIVVAGMTLLAAARVRPAVSITITNNSQSQIRNLYLAPADHPDDWGPNQLAAGGLGTGGASTTLNSVTCDGSGVRVIAEDQNGCFIYHSVTCGDSATWTITSSESADCGNNN